MQKTRNRKNANGFNKPAGKKCTVSAIVDKQMAEALTKIAKKEGCPRCALIEGALLKYLEKDIKNGKYLLV